MRVLTEPEIVAAAPSFLNPKRNWSGKCEAAAFNLTDRFTPGIAVRSFPSATAARKASKIEGPGFGPPGSWVWMSGVWVKENGVVYDAGHVAYHLGNNLLFMASSSVRGIPGFTALGFIDGHAYLRRFPNQKLEGWSRDHGGTVIPEPPAPATAPVEAVIERSSAVGQTVIILHRLPDGNAKHYQFDAREGICELGAGVDLGLALALRQQKEAIVIEGWNQFDQLNNAAAAVRQKARQNAEEDAKDD